MTTPILADLHGHTKFCRFFGTRMGEFVDYSPKEAIEQALAVGLQVLAITGHDTLGGLVGAIEYGRDKGVIVVPGVEITSFNRWHFPHILVLGVDPLNVIDAQLPTGSRPAKVIEWANSVGAIAVAAHPSPHGKFTSLTFSEVFSHKFDAIEVLTTTGWNQTLVDWADKNSLQKLGCSDYHMLEQIGLVRTLINAEVSAWQEVILAIKQGAAKPMENGYIPEHLRGQRLPKKLLGQIANILRKERP